MANLLSSAASPNTPPRTAPAAPRAASSVPEKIVYDAITFDDVLLLPRRSDFIPAEAYVRTRLTRSIEINIPLISAPMDTVTEGALAIALAQEGGLGVIHKNLSVAAQAREVEKVKRSENGVITDPVTLPPSATIGEARQVMREYNVSGIPIVDAPARQLVIACGALAHEVAALRKANGWSTLDVVCLPPELHNRPERIAGHASTCASVGPGKARANQEATAGWKPARGGADCDTGALSCGAPGTA